jgi:hypothetical protein
MRELSVDEFSRALARYGFAISENRIFDVSGRCAGNSWPIVLNGTLQIDRRRTISPTFPTGALILEFCRRKLNLFKGRWGGKACSEDLPSFGLLDCA